MSVAVGLTLQAVYPPRVLIAVTGLTLGQSIEVYRVVDGARTLVRGGLDSSVSDTSYVVVDAELPFGTPVGYVAVVAGTDYATSTTTYTLTGGKVAASDAVTALAAEVVILAWPKISRSRQSTTFKVGSRNVAVLGPLTPGESDVTLYVESDSGNEQLAELLTQATQGTIQLRQPGGYAGVDGYYAVTTADQERWSQDGSDPRRTWTVHLVETESWAGTLDTSAYTLQDIYDHYGPSGDLADLAADYATLLDIATADWS